MKEFAKLIDVEFNDIDLLERALTHRSYLNEHPEKAEHNERLEFLGDAVIELVVTEYLYKNYPNPEGELTNWRSAIVRGEVLSEVAKEIHVGDYILLSKGEEKSGGRERNLIMANAFEAIVGAIYIDGGYEVAKKYIDKHLISMLPEVIEKKLYIDPKSNLQEITQEKLGVTPQYKVVSEEGPDHAKDFTVGVYAADKLLGKGVGPSKQKAEQAAASEALKNLSD